jgi:Leucine-rich repeat (LRR) protein
MFHKLRYFAIGTLLLTASTGFSAIPASEREALISLYESTGGDAWINQDGWAGDLGPGSECSWFRVSCDEEGSHVIGLELVRNGLTGNLPGTIADLTHLRRLDLSDNQLYGELPPELFTLAELEVLALTFNSFSGELPPAIGELSNLVTLYISANSFTGSIPATLGNLANLETLDLMSNHLSGGIPPQLGNLPRLRELFLEDNDLTGTIPDELRNLTQLEMLALSLNALEGTLPPWLGELSNLYFLSLIGNQLTGTIPAELGNLENLVIFSAFSNQLSGIIPAELGRCRELILLSLGNNQLTGHIPPELGALSKLWSLDLGNNQLCGPIPPEIGNLESLEVLFLHDTRVSGDIPPELGKLGNLEFLLLIRNQLSGSIPPELGSLRNLQSMSLSSNRLSGEIPREITFLTQLEQQDLGIFWNALYTNDPEVRDFINQRAHPKALATQTIAPPASSLVASAVGETELSVSWDPVEYTDDPGSYTVLLGRSATGPFIPYADTQSKDETSMAVLGLSPGTRYWVAVQTATDPHRWNKNLVHSDLTAVAEVSTPGQAPAIAAIGEHVVTVPAAAHVAGESGTSWRTDLVLHNSGGEPVAASLVLLERDQDGSGSTPFPLSVAAGQSLRLDDVVGDLFELVSGAGAVLVGSDLPLLVSSRTYNDAILGTYGQYIPGESMARAATIRDTAWLIQLTEDHQYRTNLGVVNPGAAPLEVSIELFAEGRGSLGRQQITVAAYSAVQLYRVFGDKTVADGRARLWSATPGAAFFAYASVVDNFSGDSICVLPATATDDTLFIPAIANSAGSQGTSWRSDLELFNVSDEEALLRVELLRRDRDNSSPVAIELSLGPGTALRYGNLLQTLFGQQGAGALRIVVESGRIMANSRTYNDSAAGTFGQLIPAFTAAQSLKGYNQTRLVQLSSSTSPALGFRTNIGFVNIRAVPIDLEIDLYRGDGELLGTLSDALQPHDARQLNDVFNRIGAGVVEDGFAVIRCDSRAARYFAYASVVDNRTGDAIFVPASGEAQ